MKKPTALAALTAAALIPSGLVATWSSAATASSAAQAPAEAAHAVASGSVDMVQLRIEARSQGLSSRGSCGTGERVSSLKGTLIGEATSSNPQLSGRVTIRARVLIDESTGVGATTAKIRISDPVTGRQQATLNATQVESQGGTAFDGLLQGVLHETDQRLVATYFGRLDPDTGQAVLVVGNDPAAQPRSAGVLIDCNGVGQ